MLFITASGKLTQMALAELAEIGRSHISAIELGNVGVSFDVIFKLCEVLEITRRIRTESKKSKYDTRAKFSFENKDDPNYVRPKVTTPYTSRQKDILDGIIPLDAVGLNELTNLLQKAIDLEDAEAERIVRNLKEIKLNPAALLPKLTKEEALKILKELDARKEKCGTSAIKMARQSYAS